MSVRRVTMNGVARLGVGIALVGRRAEMTALGAALERAADGKPTGVLLAGDAGVGKSRLVIETVERAADAPGYAVLTGRCLDSGTRCRTCRSPRSSGSSWRAGPSSSPHTPSWRGCCPATCPARRSTASSGSCRVFDAMLRRSIRCPPRRPPCWCSRTCTGPTGRRRDLLVFLCRGSPRNGSSCWPPTAPTTCTGATRCGRCCPSWCGCPPSNGWTGPARRGRHARPRSSGWRNGSLSEELVRRAAERSEGNAFFAEELVSAGVRARCPTGSPRCCMARIEGLPQATQQVLRLAAVAGRRVEHGLLAAVSELPDDELEQALRDAVAHHVLVADAGDAYVFRHALLREAIYTELLPGERSRLHARYARLFAEQDAEESAAAELAHHAVAAPRSAARAWPPRCGPRGRPIGRAAPAEVLLHVEARAGAVGRRCPSPSRSPASTEVRAHHLGGVDGERQRRSGSGHRAGPSRARSRRARRRSGAHGHPVPPLRHASAGAHRPRPGGPRRQLPRVRAARRCCPPRPRRRGRRWSTPGCCAGSTSGTRRGRAPTPP